MYIELIYDLLLKIEFLVFGRYPIALMDQIADKKLAIYQSLSVDLGRPYIKVGVEEFVVEGRKFTVTFSSDTTARHAPNIRPLYVATIEEHS